MLHVRLKSSHIAAVAYDEETHHLVVYFYRDQPREFEAVPERAFKKFTRAASPGTFYIKNVREKYKRVNH